MSAPTVLARRLGLLESVGVGLAAMVGAGVFAAFPPAAAASGNLLWLALLLAALVAWCNAFSSARLAVRHPRSGGTYVYAGAQLGPLWGFLAGWGFVVGKTASCAAMAWTVGAYAWPEHQREIAVLATLVVVALDVVGVQRSARVALAGVLVVIAVLVAVVVAAALVPAGGDPTGSAPGSGPVGVLGGAGLLFFAFAGYARLATLGEEVRDPGRTIPRAVAIALLVTAAVYAALAWALVRTLGVDGLAGSTDAVADAVRALGLTTWVPVVRVVAVLAAAGALLTVVLGISRTALAMARNGDLPRALARVEPRRQVPVRAQLAVGAVVVVLVLLVDLRGAIGFSSFAILVYYLLANLSAWTLGPRPVTRVTAAVGALGCVALAVSLPWTSVLAGLVVLGLGAAVHLLRRRVAP
ncbi:APC family permease [Desertihabitans aurantiacus]|uniref:APC family permease n=1 Tax=Desertihabitans aurantiacus TaxID=2282477 RepID=UPI001E29464A|nr:APC family permease [Desertihabitans aurantiacus]